FVRPQLYHGKENISQIAHIYSSYLTYLILIIIAVPARYPGPTRDDSSPLSRLVSRTSDCISSTHSESVSTGIGERSRSMRRVLGIVTLVLSVAVIGCSAGSTSGPSGRTYAPTNVSGPPTNVGGTTPPAAGGPGAITPENTKI